MAYKTEDLMQSAIKAIEEHRLVFIEDIIAYLPCHKSTFYEHFPNESDNYKELIDKLDTNRVNLKVSMRKKWHDSDNATLQLSLMKLVCTDDERKKLAMQYNEHSGEIKTVNLSNLTTEELVARAKAIKEVDEQTRV